MKILPILVCSGLLLLVTSCNKDDLIPKIVDELEFDCPAGHSESFFEGFMDDKQFCYYDGVDKYNQEISMTSSFRTDGPTTSTGGDPTNLEGFRVWANFGFRPKANFTNNPATPLPHLKHYLFVETPISTSTEVTLTELLESHITGTGNLPLRSDRIDNIEGFNIAFHFNDGDAGVSRIFEASGGNQDDSYLMISELNFFEPRFGVKEYFVTFEFACNLYYNGNPDRFYARIEQGVMKLHFTLE